MGATSAYWKNIVKPLATGDSYSLACDPKLVGVGSSVPGFTTDIVQAMYSLDMCGGGKVNGFGDETTPLAQLDYWGSDFSGNAGILGASGNYYGTNFGPNAFFNSQFHSLRGWRNLGTGNYNAMQVVLRKRLTHGVQFDFNYTYSKSIDLSSNAERITTDGSLNIGGLTINSWSPYQLRGVSDFDTTHQFNTNWVIELPFGKGRAIAHEAHGSHRSSDRRLAAVRLGPVDLWFPGDSGQQRHLAHQLAVARRGHLDWAGAVHAYDQAAGRLGQPVRSAASGDRRWTRSLPPRSARRERQPKPASWPRFRRPGPRAQQALEDAMGGIAQPSAPLGSLQRAEPHSVRRGNHQQQYFVGFVR